MESLKPGKITLVRGSVSSLLREVRSSGIEIEYLYEPDYTDLSNKVSVNPYEQTRCFVVKTSLSSLPKGLTVDPLYYCVVVDYDDNSRSKYSGSVKLETPSYPVDIITRSIFDNLGTPSIAGTENITLQDFYLLKNKGYLMKYLFRGSTGYIAPYLQVVLNKSRSYHQFIYFFKLFKAWVWYCTYIYNYKHARYGMIVIGTDKENRPIRFFRASRQLIDLFSDLFNF